MGRSTIQDIARRVGVSAAVVPHVINDHPGHVSAATRRRVREVIAAREGYQVLLVNAETLAAEREALAALTAHPVDGLIVMSTSQRQESRHLADTDGIPVIAINRYGGRSSLSRILWDDRAGARTAVQQLLALGHRRIGLIGGPRGRLSTTWWWGSAIHPSWPSPPRRSRRWRSPSRRPDGGRQSGSWTRFRAGRRAAGPNYCPAR